MRVQMQFSRETVLAFNEFKRLKYGDANITITNGYVLGVAYESIKSRLSTMVWKDINNADIPNVTVDGDKSVEGVKSTLNIEQAVLDGIEQIQKDIKKEFGGKRIHRAFAVKLIMFAAIIYHDGNNEDK